MGIIYVLTNKINGKQYVGQTVRTFNRRLSQHVNMSKKDKPKRVISKAIKKYSIDNFSIETHDIMNCCLDDVEKVMIKTLNTKAPNGYNLTDGGEGVYGYVRSEEFKRKMSIANTGKIVSKKTGRKMSIAHIGKHHTEEAKRKMAKSSCKYTYEVTKPNGDIDIIDNMRKYCRENNLNQAAMRKVINGKANHHHNYTARILNELKKEN